MWIPKRTAVTLIVLGIAMMFVAMAPGMPKFVVFVGAALAAFAAIVLIAEALARPPHADGAPSDMDDAPS